jgi:hypothetical protein
VLKHYGVVMLAGSDFNVPADKFYCRMACTDYDGPNVVKLYMSSKLKSMEIEDYMPNLVEGCNRLQDFVAELSKPKDNTIYDSVKDDIDNFFTYNKIYQT